MIKIKFNKTKPKDIPLEVRQVFKHIDTEEALYMIIGGPDNYGHSYYALINITSGVTYSAFDRDINKVFGDFRHKFILVEEDIQITVG